MKKTTQIALASSLLIASGAAVANNDTTETKTKTKIETGIAPIAMTDEQMDKVVGAGFEDLFTSLKTGVENKGLAIAAAAKQLHKRPAAKKPVAKKAAAKP